MVGLWQAFAVKRCADVNGANLGIGMLLSQRDPPAVVGNKTQHGLRLTNAQTRRNREYRAVPPLLKSRLAGCGNLAGTDGLRTDSPAADDDLDGRRHKGTCARPTSRSSDSLRGFSTRNADEEIHDGAAMAARVPVYRTHGAARASRPELKSTVQAHDFALDFVLRALFALRSEGGKILALLTANTEHLLYGHLTEGEAAMQKIVDRAPPRRARLTPTGTGSSAQITRRVRSSTCGGQDRAHRAS